MLKLKLELAVCIIAAVSFVIMGFIQYEDSEYLNKAMSTYFFVAASIFIVYAAIIVNLIFYGAS